MDYKELFLAIGIMLLVTGLYIAVRKLIAWAIEDNARWRKKNGSLGLSKGARDVNKKHTYFKATCGYVLMMALLALYIVKLVVDAA